MKLTTEQSLTLNNAIGTYGKDNQLEMCVEECSELIQAICKWNRKESLTALGQLIDEMADVSIMLEQMKLMFDKTGDATQNRIDFKIERLKQRLEAKK